MGPLKHIIGSTVIKVKCTGVCQAYDFSLFPQFRLLYIHRAPLPLNVWPLKAGYLIGL